MFCDTGTARREQKVNSEGSDKDLSGTSAGTNIRWTGPGCPTGCSSAVQCAVVTFA